MSKFAIRSAVLMCLSALLTAPHIGAQLTVRVGAEFQVNHYTPGYQSQPVVMLRADSGFVVVWESGEQDGYSYGIFGRRFDSAGLALGAEFQVSVYTADRQRTPAAAMDVAGSFVVTWFDEGQDGSDAGVFARRFDSTGVPEDAEFQVNTYTPYDQWFSAVALDAEGDFVIVWQGYGVDGPDNGVLGQRFDSSGLALGSEFQVNAYTIGYQNYPAVAVTPTGDFVVAWESDGQDGSGNGIFARRFDSAGAPQATEFQVNTYTPGDQRYAAVARNATGAFVVVWESGGQDGSNLGVFVRRFDSSGAPQAAELQVNTYTLNEQAWATAAIDGAGNFVVAWHSYGQDGSRLGVFARRFDSSGAPQAAELQVNTYTPINQADPSVVLDENGGFIVAWDSNQYAGGASGVFAQRFATVALATLDIDGDGETEALTDGLLVVRYLFGFTGATLVAGAVDMDCTRCDAAAIEPYLGGLGTTLDVDDDGATGALTDGLLLLRYLFGFTDGALINSVVGLQCQRCEAAAIEAYLANLT